MFKNYFKNFSVIASLFVYMSSTAQTQTFTPDISKQENFTVANRSISFKNNNGKIVVHLDAKPGNGVAWIKNISFEKGIIEFDVKGKDVLQQSFVGVAFHGTNDSAYDGIYFRPFNFNSTDTARKNHSVQYISMPQYDWQYLRQTFPGKYEHELTSTIDANNWFHAKIIVYENSIEVFVNNNANACLTVTPLNKYHTGKIGFWVGNNSDGDFANLSIKQ